MVPGAGFGELVEEGQLDGIRMEVNLGVGALVGLGISRFNWVTPYLL